MSDTTELPDYVGQAIAALTAAARQKRTIGQGTPGESEGPVDFGEIASFVLASVAANVGGVEELLAGRPGSWEADYVRQFVHSTVGDDDDALLRHRTEPVRVSVDIDDIFNSFGLEELEEEARDALEAVFAQLQDELFEAEAAVSELARHKELADAAARSDWSDDPKRHVDLMTEHGVIYKAAIQRALDADHPKSAALLAARSDLKAFEELVTSDRAAYLEGYSQAVRETLAARGLTCEFVSFPAEYHWDELAESAETAARLVAVLPMTGQAPDWSDGTPADAVRRAGRTYLDRLDRAAT